MAKKDNMHTGGTPNFDERAGTFLPRVGSPAKDKLKRLSPGVYRNSAGDLVTQQGRKLPRPTPPPSIQSLLEAYGGGRPAPSGPSILDGIQNARPLRPDERAGRGIDPRDPNTYSVMPDGKLMGTLMGWFKNPDEMQRTLLAAQQGAESARPQIPTASTISDLLRRRG